MSIGRKSYRRSGGKKLRRSGGNTSFMFISGDREETLCIILCRIVLYEYDSYYITVCIASEMLSLAIGGKKLKGDRASERWGDQFLGRCYLWRSGGETLDSDRATSLLLFCCRAMLIVYMLFLA